ncbi:MAG TPA: hypothetical protein VF808_13230 [Ktedonobacterales bacterium]
MRLYLRLKRGGSYHSPAPGATLLAIEGVIAVNEVELLQSTNDPRLLEAMDANHAFAFGFMASGLGGVVEHEPALTRFISGIPVSMLNGVALARLPEEGIDAAIAAALRPFEERALPLLWWVGTYKRAA